MSNNSRIESGKRIVVKIGSTLLADQENGAVHREWLTALAEEAKRHGLVVVVWSYPRGAGISKEGETALDAVVREKRREDRLREAGWLVIRVTWDDVIHHPARTVQRIRAFLAMADRRPCTG